ncbi:hypothetical protein [Halopenitus persicus]|uniref:Uncharacterized protein n=1 Tax=Halopenitus persicus TaxID=1048396 RepID=A0A1H3KZD9_9EURY|nr:hypothetical protein [Halopenitus persicus]QHS18044.1 hypothetical protein GWK26_13255 [haloarchaeon 3A1-DGR]SDY57078.1 hypothetical protein SAMN05216564_106210 [Halopenitus persicus]
MTPVEFLAELVFGVYQLATIFLENVVANGDPLSILAFLVGQVLLVGSIVAIAYLTVGALASTVGIQLPSPGK